MRHERITIHFEGTEVGIEYHPETPEAELRDALRATEIGLHALAQHALRQRQEAGLALPPVLQAVVDAATYRELL